MKGPGANEILDASTGLVCRVQLKERVRPQGTTTHLLLDLGPKGFVSNRDEALRVGPILGDQVVPQVEDIHLITLRQPGIQNQTAVILGGERNPGGQMIVIARSDDASPGPTGRWSGS